MRIRTVHFRAPSRQTPDVLADAFSKIAQHHGPGGASAITHAAPKLMAFKKTNHQLRFASHLELVFELNALVAAYDGTSKTNAVLHGVPAKSGITLGQTNLVGEI
jgi:hypothetical protein